MDSDRPDLPTDQIAALRTNLNLLRYSLEQMTETIKALVHEVRAAETRLNTLESHLARFEG